jgi:hypothetical protein
MKRFATLTALAAIFLACPLSVQVSHAQGINAQALIPGLINHAKVIGGTEFPWTDRAGNVTKLKQYFEVTGFIPSIPLITVNGYPTTITWTDWNHGYWEYSGTPIGVGAGPGLFTLTIQYYGWTGLPIPTTSGNPAPIDLWVYKVEHVVEPNNLEASSDVVYTRNDLYYSRLSNFWVTSSISLDHMAREIRSLFKVTAPPQASGDFSGITVGIAQCQVANPNTERAYKRDFGTWGQPTGRSITTWNNGPIWVDATNTGFGPYYSSLSYKTGQAGQQGNVWLCPTLTPLKLSDAPDEHLGYYQPEAGTLFEWGQIVGDQRRRGGIPMNFRFEVVLGANSLQCPGIYVDIHGFKEWSFQSDGYIVLGDPADQWHGGFVKDLGDKKAKIFNGPTMNASAVPSFQSP